MEGNCLTPELHQKMGRLTSILHSDHAPSGCMATARRKTQRHQKEAASLVVTETKIKQLLSFQTKIKKKNWFNAISHYSVKPQTTFRGQIKDAKREIITFPGAEEQKNVLNVRSSAASSPSAVSLTSTTLCFITQSLVTS